MHERSNEGVRASKRLARVGVWFAITFALLLVQFGGPTEGMAAGGTSPMPLDSLARPLAPGYSRRLFDVKFSDGSQVRLDNNTLRGLSPQSNLPGILYKYQPTAITHLFTLPGQELDQLRAGGEARTGKRLPDLNLWFRFTLPSGADPQGFMDAIKSLEGVETVEPAPLPPPPPGYPLATTPSFSASQGYLNAAPNGINANYSWTIRGGNGAGVTIFDVEYSWNQTHEDLGKAHGLVPLLSPGDTAVDPFGDKNHGTAVLGELVADKNTIGVNGIAWGSSVRLAPAYTQKLLYAPQNAIALAAAAGSAGDVILIEQQFGVCKVQPPCIDTTQGGCGPLEGYLPVFQAIQIAVAKGIVVVEAAGNGKVNLDQPSCNNLFNRSVRDSGAIIVGAGGSPRSSIDRQRESFSSYGSRVDVQGWGDSVETAGYGKSLGAGYVDPSAPTNPNRWYTSRFGGTSSASSMVAGAAADIEGIAKSILGRPRTSTDVRSLLTSTGSPQLGNTLQHIGPRPNLKAAIGKFAIGNIYGYVKDAKTGSAIAGVAVTFSGVGGTKNATTNTAGRYAFSALFVGKGSITAVKSGYVTKSINLTVFAGANTLIPNILLTRSP